MSSRNAQDHTDMDKLMNSAILAMKYSKTNAATNTNNVFSALDKVEERKRKLELEIESSKDEIAIAKEWKLISKLDGKADYLFEAFFKPKIKVLLSGESLCEYSFCHTHNNSTQLKIKNKMEAH